MLQLADAEEQPGITSIFLSVEDGVPLPSSLLRQGVDFVLAEKRRGQIVLIACGAGVSRSVASSVPIIRSKVLFIRCQVRWVPVGDS
jgi:hypothetical protein